MFNGTQPSNGGCTNDTSIDGQVTIDCGLGTALLDCNFNSHDLSDLSNLSVFAWNKIAIVSQRVSIIFTFNQQINANIIHMFFWSYTNDNIRVPSVAAYWSDDNSVPPSIQITASYNTNCTDSIGGCILTITG